MNTDQEGCINNADGISRIPCNQCRKSDRDSAHALNAVGPSFPGSLDSKSLQEDDRDISLIRACLEKGEKPGPADLKTESFVVKTFKSESVEEIYDRLLERKYDVHDAGIINWQMIVPQTQRRLVLRLLHDVPSPGHLGIKKPLSTV